MIPSIMIIHYKSCDMLCLLKGEGDERLPIIHGAKLHIRNN